MRCHAACTIFSRCRAMPPCRSPPEQPAPTTSTRAFGQPRHSPPRRPDLVRQHISTLRYLLASLHSAALPSRRHLPRNPHLVPHLPRAARAWAQHDVSAPGRHTASRFPGQTTPYRLQSSIFSLTAAEQLPAPPHQSSSSTSADSKLLNTRPKPPFPVGASLHVLGQRLANKPAHP